MSGEEHSPGTWAVRGLCGQRGDGVPGCRGRFGVQPVHDAARVVCRDHDKGRRALTEVEDLFPPIEIRAEAAHPHRERWLVWSVTREPDAHPYGVQPFLRWLSLRRLGGPSGPAGRCGVCGSRSACQEGCGDDHGQTGDPSDPTVTVPPAEHDRILRTAPQRLKLFVRLSLSQHVAVREVSSERPYSGIDWQHATLSLSGLISDRIGGVVLPDVQGRGRDRCNDGAKRL